MMLVATAAFAQGLKEEHTDVVARLNAEKAALDGLKTQRVSLADVLGLFEKRAKLQQRRTARLDRDLKAVRRQIELAERREAWARAVVEAKTQELAPRLLVLYRLKKKNPLDVLLSAKDFATLVRTSRSVGTLMERDLELLDQVRVASAFQAQSLEQLDRLKTSMNERMLNLEDEREQMADQRAELADLLASLQAEARQSSRNVKDLEAAERQLKDLLHELENPPEHGFGALRGKLAPPLDGVVEVGFGKIVNPRFNTVVLQKGIDVRAAEGTPVRAVGPGTVVHAGWVRGYGNVLIVEHPGVFHTVMAHLSSFLVDVGETVEPGQEIAKVGDSASVKGSYLYFEIRQRGLAVDPQPWFAAGSYR
jgi:septal ring factor EnvC (AmiA/AmiB activator)